MNAVWRPQDQYRLRAGYLGRPRGRSQRPEDASGAQDGLRNEKPGVAYSPRSPRSWADKNSGWFAQHRVPGMHMTFFVVHKIPHSGGDPVVRAREVSRRTAPCTSPLGVSFISDLRLPSTFAHEAGHYVGDMPHEGVDTALLMREEGAGYKIPFEQAKRFRESVAKSGSRREWRLLRQDPHEEVEIVQDVERGDGMAGRNATTAPLASIAGAALSSIQGPRRPRLTGEI